MIEVIKKPIRKNIRESAGDRIFYIFVIFIMLIALIITLYPIWYVVCMSFSDSMAVMKKEVYLYPIGFNIESYRRVLNPSTGIFTAYKNTIIYTVAGTTLNVVLTVMLAYPLSQKRFWGRNKIALFVTFTMLVSGGMIPNFLLVRALNLYNTRWALILPGAIQVYNMILARTFFAGIPDSMSESASIDGANDVTILSKIILPLSMPIIAVLILFYAVGHWNTYFNALLYLPNQKLQPLQMYLVRLLVQNEQLLAEGGEDTMEMAMQNIKTKYATIMVVVAPILCVYPFLQKYFVQGIMIGAIKE
ncbi:MAG: carbohydrate ABC transporter permease [Christensenellales bacterium]|jgi:putative aldouronate transport system permease protein